MHALFAALVEWNVGQSRRNLRYVRAAPSGSCSTGTQSNPELLAACYRRCTLGQIGSRAVARPERFWAAAVT
jgi:hypothetical protein